MCGEHGHWLIATEGCRDDAGQSLSEALHGARPKIVILIAGQGDLHDEVRKKKNRRAV